MPPGQGDLGRGEYFHQKLKLFRDASKVSKLFRNSKFFKMHDGVKFLEILDENSCFWAFFLVFFMFFVTIFMFFKKICEFFENFVKTFPKMSQILKVFRDAYHSWNENIHPCLRHAFYLWFVSVHSFSLLILRDNINLTKISMVYISTRSSSSLNKT